MKYIIAIKKTKYGYDTHVPALPGCHSQGNTEREALANTRDAILTYLDMEQMLQICNKHVNEITNINALSKSFDFLSDEPELYSVSDLKVK